MIELDILLGQRDAALYREDMARVDELEIRIAALAAELRLKIMEDCTADLVASLRQFEEELRGSAP